ncbi:MAG: histidine phosphatase family protein [Geodermatophilaceae bacterium]
MSRADRLNGGPEGLGVRRVVLWRHGRTTWNAAGRFQGQSDPPLDQVGQEQSRQAARYLAVDPPDLILTSDLVRATSTAAALTELIDTPIKIEPRLREIDLGSWQGLTRDEVAASYPEQFAQWLDGQPVLDRGGETRAQLDTRVLAALRDIVVDHVLFVTHGGAARSIIEVLLDLPPHAGRWLTVLGNCHWSHLERYPGGWQLRTHNLAPASETLRRDAGVAEDDRGDADAVDAGAQGPGADAGAPRNGDDAGATS